MKKPNLPWNEVEREIRKEMAWIKTNISAFLTEEVGTAITCRDCLIRQIAILILSGKVKATEITKDSKLESFWNTKTNFELPKTFKHFHGGEWHRKTMKEIESHFLSRGFDVVREPALHWGRADLGVYKVGTPDLLIEVGTTTFFKLWLNLEAMKHFVYLIVPNDDKLIEFICNN